MIGLLAVSLVPIFFGLLLGYGAGKLRLVDNRDLRSLISFVMNYALPCALFLAIVKAPLGLLREQAGVSLVLAAIYLVVYFVVYRISRWLGHESGDAAVLALTVAFPNVTAVGIPLLDAMYGQRTAVTVALGIAVGAVTISPITLSLLEDTTAAGHSLSVWQRLWRAVARAVRRPVVWAPVAALVAVLLEVPLPGYAVRSLNTMGSATAGAALFVTGLIVSAQPFRLHWQVAATVTMKNLLQPALCLGLALALRLPTDEVRALVLMAAIPCGFFGMVFGKGFGRTPQLASSSLIVSYGIGLATMAEWIVLLARVT